MKRPWAQRPHPPGWKRGKEERHRWEPTAMKKNPYSVLLPLPMLPPSLPEGASKWSLGTWRRGPRHHPSFDLGEYLFRAALIRTIRPALQESQQRRLGCREITLAHQDHAQDILCAGFRIHALKL